ncbi:MAG: diacylglycerol/polyprenol kinase family protein [Elainellaceae cyanobacterium]
MRHLRAWPPHQPVIEVVNFPGGSLVDIASAPLYLRLFIVIAWLGLVLAIAGVVNYSYRSDDAVADPRSSEAVRKVVHIGTGNVILLAWWLNIPAWIGIGASVVASGITLLSYWRPILPVINSVGRRSFGTFFYSLSIGILIALFWPLKQPEYAALGVLVMAWGDGMAALVGQRFGSHPYEIGGMKKSWEGSLAMAVASGVVSFGVLWIAHIPGYQANLGQMGVVALAIALLATTLEAISIWGIDNLTVPFCSAIAAWQLAHWG